MIKEKVRIHGGESFEIDLGYLYNSDKRASTYDVDTYIFTPRGLDINKYTYSKSDFFQDLKANIRFLTPEYGLAELLLGDDSAFSKLNNSIDAFITKRSNDNATQYRYHVKMFVSIFRSSISKHVSRIVSKTSLNEKRSLIKELFIELEEILSKYRSLHRKIRNAKLGERYINVFIFGDEYLSYTVEKQLLILIRKLSRRKDDSLIEERLEAQSFLETELEYQKKIGVLQLKTSSNKSNENTIYRRGILRKFAEDRLFLNTTTEKEGAFMEQIIFSLSAGFAMIFATGIAFLSQQHYGNFTLPFFSVLVFSYMAKDRIKEIVRKNINTRIQAKFFFDNKTKIISGDSKIGICRESFIFIDEKKIPEFVMKVRKREHLTEIENGWKGENVIRYHKRVTIYNKKFRNVFKEYEIKGIKDIVRINISRFSSKMSSPYLPFYAWDRVTKEVKKVKGEKVYHFNVIMVFKYNNEKHLKRYRVFLNKNGIKRIEKVSN
ncbi:MAG: hypothetical protein KAH10_06715 [Flavobacteriales bacterium]|nr:hypothetical protein [Flavobacteriales bacterium]